jgi:hypothetical protein
MKAVYCFKKQVTDMQTTVTFYKDGDPLVTHVIKPRSVCGDFVQIKWLDNNGQYRFFPFLENRKENINVKELGELSVFNVSLVGALSKSKIVSKDVTKNITLYQINVTSEERKILETLYSSIDIYMSYGVSNVWQRIKLKGDAPVILPKNDKTSTIELNVTLELNSMSL